MAEFIHLTTIIYKPVIALLIALSCGLAIPFSFAPHGLVFIEVMSLAIMFFIVKPQTRRFASTLWFAFGIGMFGYGVWWIQVSVHQFGLPLYSFSVTVTAGLIVVQALHIALFGWLIQPLLVGRHRFFALFGIPATWVLIEFLRSWFGSGFPWLLLGYAHTGTVLGGFAPIGGAHLVSFIVVYLAIALKLMFMRRDVVVAASAIVIICVAFGAKLIDWNEGQPKIPKTVALVQGAVPQEIKWHPDVRQPSIELHQKLSEPYWQGDVIVWPETAIPAFPDEVPEVIQSLGKRVASEKAVLLVGMPTRSIEQDGELRRRYYNSLLHISEGATLTASGISYSKRHLVPFGEFMPFDALLRPITDLLNVPMSDFSAGAPQQSSLVADDIIFGASICYEDAYAELVRDALPAANVLVNISNDAWFGATIAPHQHLQISQMRALELGRYMLRATNTGISAVIDDKGQVIAKSKQFVPQALSAKFSLLNGVTPFARFGTTPIFFWCVLSAIVIFVQNRRSQE